MPDYSYLHKTTWCSLPWLHQFVNPQGQIKPCCRFLLSKEEENENNLNKKSLDEAFLSPFMNNIRSKMLNNEKVKGCIRCYEEETSHKKSLRELYNQMDDLSPNQLISDISNPKIRWLELAISNDCNLACRMCDSRYSTKWFNEEKDFYGKTFSKTKKTKFDINEISPFLKDIVHIKITGGEPLMTPDHFILIDKLLEQGIASNIFLDYSTNLTITPSDSLIEKWKKFKYIEIDCSFDGIGDVWELVRYPSKWKKTEKIIPYFFKLTHELDCNIGLRSTISVNNILGMAESFKWWIENWDHFAACPFNENQKINPTHVSFPRFLSTTVLPKKYKAIIADKLIRQSRQLPDKMKSSIKTQINYMMSADHSCHLKKLRDYTLHFDKKRNQDFFKVNPELKGLFDEII